MLESDQKIWSQTEHIGNEIPTKELYTNPLTHIFTKMNRKGGGAVWVGGVIKVFGRGGWWNSMSLTLPITKIFDKIYACNMVCRLELEFFYFFTQNSVKIACFYDFLTENRFLPICCVYFQYVQHFEIALILWRRSDVIHRWMILIWKEETHSYTLVANIRV